MAEFFVFGLFAAVVVTTFFLARKIYGDGRTSLVSAVLLLTFPFFTQKGTEIRPDILQVLFGLLSFYFLVVYLSEKTDKKPLALSALLLSLSFLSLQKAVFFVCFMGFALLYYLFKGAIRKGTGLQTKDFFLYWAVFCLLPMSYAVFLHMTGGFQNYFDFNWLINMELLHSFSPAENFPLSFRRRLFMTLGAAFFVFLFVRGCFLKAGALHRLAVLAGACLTASVFFVKLPYPQYFLMASPFIAIVAAFSLCRLFTGLTAKAVLTVFVLLCSSYLILNTKDGGRKKEAISRMEYVLSVSEPGDAYFGYKSNLFRNDASFFWFCTGPKRCLETYQSLRGYEYDPVRIIKETRPKIIEMRADAFPPAIIENPYVVNNYERSSEHPSIYVRKGGR